MAKSKIIKELANGETDTITALKRAKVLLMEFDNPQVSEWINYEIIGYPADAELPDYRQTRGNLMGSYFRGTMVSYMTCKNVSIPLGKMPDDLQEKLLTVVFRDGLEALRKLAQDVSEENGQLGKTISADFFPAMANYNDDPCMMITSARVVVGSQLLNNIFSVIENKLLDVLVLLEKEFGCLDDLDLDMSTKTEEEINSLNERLVVLIYNDNSVTIGNENKIKGSTIASSVEE